MGVLKRKHHIKLINFTFDNRVFSLDWQKEKLKQKKSY